MDSAPERNARRVWSVCGERWAMRKMLGSCEKYARTGQDWFGVSKKRRGGRRSTRDLRLNRRQGARNMPVFTAKGGPSGKGIRAAVAQQILVKGALNVDNVPNLHLKRFQSHADLSARSAHLCSLRAGACVLLTCPRDLSQPAS